MSWSHGFTARNKVEARKLINEAPYVPHGVKTDVLLIIERIQGDGPMTFLGNGHMPNAHGEWPDSNCSWTFKPLVYSLPEPPASNVEHSKK